jgi:hypothetical protein
MSHLGETREAVLIWIKLYLHCGIRLPQAKRSLRQNSEQDWFGEDGTKGTSKAPEVPQREQNLE